jgi:RHS repeat-associated protein
MDGTGSVQKSYVWGLDLNQSLQDAGGIGGLLSVVDTGEAYNYLYDVNGNVGQLIDSDDGSIVAHYEYDPFGILLKATGLLVNENPLRFSTKYYDTEIGLYYYGYRYYSASLGRWINRDPIEEGDTANLYLFTLNNPMSNIDPNGLITLEGLIQSNIGYDKSFPLLGPFGIPVGLSGARFQIHIYFSGNYFNCCRNGKTATFATGTIGSEAYLIWGKGKSRPIKGRDRNKPDPYRPGKQKIHPYEPPDSGFRNRSWHLDYTTPLAPCPADGFSFQNISGVIFLRGSAGVGLVGAQFNIQKMFAKGVQLDEGWSLTGSVAGNIWGATIEAGGGGFATFNYGPITSH